MTNIVTHSSRYWTIKKAVFDFFKYVFLIYTGIVVVTPIVVVFLSSFKTNQEMMLGTPFALPETWQLENYIHIFTVGRMPSAYMNTGILILISTVGSVVFGTMVAYVLSRFKFRFRNVVLFMYIIGLILPGITIEISRFQIISSLGLFNTIWAPIILYIGVDIIQIYLYLQFANSIPYSLDESAMIDGASFFKVYIKIFFPLLLPATATVAILKFVGIFNDYYTQFLYMPSVNLRTAATILNTFQGARFNLENYLSAAIMLITIPALILYFIFQRWIFSGIVMGSIKS